MCGGVEEGLHKKNRRFWELCGFWSRWWKKNTLYLPWILQLPGAHERGQINWNAGRSNPYLCASVDNVFFKQNDKELFWSTKQTLSLQLSRCTFDVMWKWAVIRNEEMSREQYLPRLMVVRDSQQQTRKRNRDYSRYEDYSRRWDILWLNCITTWENYSKIWRKLPPSSDWFVATPASMSVCYERLSLAILTTSAI